MSTQSTTGASPASSAAAHQFDFWLGDWEVSWEGGSGTNHIRSILDNQVVQEDFKAHAAEDGTPGLHGMSFSVYDSNTQQWRQTWVDNSGSYLDFTGTFQDGRMVLVTERVVNGEHKTLRMVWYDIEDDHVEWNWERRNDDGETWQTLWHISYWRASMPVTVHL